MKRNPEDRYVVSDDPRFIEDADTGIRHLFLIDRKNNLVFRSMLEEDIKPVLAQSDATRKEKKEKIATLKQFLSEEGSQNYFFVIEEIHPIDYNSDNFKSEGWDWIYGYPRVPIGFGARVQKEKFFVLQKPKQYIESILFDEKYKKSDKVRELVAEAAKCYGMDGKAWILPA